MNIITIEKKAKKTWGTTEVPQFATYMLQDGTMLNGTYGGYQRDIDHRQIVEVMYITSKKKYDGLPYVRRFMARGNIRMNCNSNSINLQFWKIPSRDQWITLQTILKEAEELGLQIYIEKYYPTKRAKVFFSEREFANWLQSQVNWYLY